MSRRSKELRRQRREAANQPKPLPNLHVIALHEAAHAVADGLAGIRVKSIHVAIREGKVDAATHVFLAGGRALPRWGERVAVMHLVGAYAAHLLGGIGLDDAGGQSDRRKAVAVLRWAYPDENGRKLNAIWQRLHQEARTLVRDQEFNIRRLAAALEAAGTMTEAEVAKYLPAPTGYLPATDSPLGAEAA